MGLLSSIASLAKNLGEAADTATRRPAPALVKADNKKPARRPTPENAPYFGPEAVAVGLGLCATMAAAAISR